MITPLALKYDATLYIALVILFKYYMFNLYVVIEIMSIKLNVIFNYTWKFILVNHCPPCACMAFYVYFSMFSRPCHTETHFKVLPLNHIIHCIQEIHKQLINSFKQILVKNGLKNKICLQI